MVGEEQAPVGCSVGQRPVLSHCVCVLVPILIGQEQRTRTVWLSPISQSFIPYPQVCIMCDFSVPHMTAGYHTVWFSVFISFFPGSCQLRDMCVP